MDGCYGDTVGGDSGLKSRRGDSAGEPAGAPQILGVCLVGVQGNDEEELSTHLGWKGDLDFPTATPSSRLCLEGSSELRLYVMLIKCWLRTQGIPVLMSPEKRRLWQGIFRNWPQGREGVAGQALRGRSPSAIPGLLRSGCPGLVALPRGTPSRVKATPVQNKPFSQFSPLRAWPTE